MLSFYYFVCDRVETEDSRGQWAAIRHMQIKYFYQDKDGGDYSNIDAELTDILRGQCTVLINPLTAGPDYIRVLHFLLAH